MRATYAGIVRALIDRLAVARDARIFRAVGFYRGDLEDLLEELTVEAPVPPAAYITIDREDSAPLTQTSTSTVIHGVVLVFAESLRSSYEGAVGQTGAAGNDEPSAEAQQGALDLLQAARDYLHHWQPGGDDWSGIVQPLEWNGAQHLYSSKKRNLIVYLGRFTIEAQIDEEAPLDPPIKKVRLTAKDAGGKTVYESTETLEEDGDE